MTEWQKIDVVDLWSGGSDDQVGDGWSVRYAPVTEPDDALHAIIDMNIYVSDLDWQADECGKRFGVTVQTLYLICEEPDDPGRTEVWSAIECDTDYDVTIYDAEQRAAASAERLAKQCDFAWTLLWDGRTRTSR